MDKPRGGRGRGPQVRLHPSEEGPHASCTNRAGAPTVGPATRIGRKRGRRPCWGQSPTCVLGAGEDVVLRGEARAEAASSMPPGENGGSQGLWGLWTRCRGEALPHDTCTNCPQPHTAGTRTGWGQDAPTGQTQGQSPAHTTGARPSCSQDWPGQWAGSVGALLGLQPAPTTGPEACLAPGSVRPVKE